MLLIWKSYIRIKAKVHQKTTKWVKFFSTQNVVFSRNLKVLLLRLNKLPSLSDKKVEKWTKRFELRFRYSIILVVAHISIRCISRCLLSTGWIHFLINLKGISPFDSFYLPRLRCRKCHHLTFPASFSLSCRRSRLFWAQTVIFLGLKWL